MSVSQALENSAKAFNSKYACDFEFVTFESRVEEFTFFRPNNGWIDVYKMTFERMYKKALERAVEGDVNNLNGESMLDDFEYTLIRPYVNTSGKEITHKPYVGMDRMARIAYLDRLTLDAPKNSVEFFAQKYKSGELTLRQMKSELDLGNAEREEYVKIFAYIQALEATSKSRSVVWKSFHPRRSHAEKCVAETMKRTLADKTEGQEAVYNEIATAAHETFDEYKRVQAGLSQSMLQAREEMTRMQKMNDAMRESLRIEGLEKVYEPSRCVERYKAPVTEKQL